MHQAINYTGRDSHFRQVNIYCNCIKLKGLNETSYECPPGGRKDKGVVVSLGGGHSAARMPISSQMFRCTAELFE